MQVPVAYKMQAAAAAVLLTVIIMSWQVFSINKEVMVLVQFPKFAINDIKVLVAEKIRDLVNVFFFFQNSNGGQKVGFPKLT